MHILLCFSLSQVDEVIGIMHKNVENVLERDRKLGDLEERADALQDGCAQFEKQAAAMKNKFWMENLKAIIAGSVVGLIVLGKKKSIDQSEASILTLDQSQVSSTGSSS